MKASTSLTVGQERSLVTEMKNTQVGQVYKAAPVKGVKKKIQMLI